MGDQTMIYDHASCPRCKSVAGVKCVVTDPSDPSDRHPHSDRVHEFMENGSLEARVKVELETEQSMLESGYDGPIEYGFFASEDEILAVLCADSE